MILYYYQTWTELEEENPWPERRSSQIAACLDHGGPHKTVLISGGWDGDITHDDMWLLDPQSGRNEKVRDHNSLWNFRFCISFFHSGFSTKYISNLMIISTNGSLWKNDQYFTLLKIIINSYLFSHLEKPEFAKSVVPPIDINFLWFLQCSRDTQLKIKL